MGRTISFTDKELYALRRTCEEWCDIMQEGEETFQLAQERLNEEGLGSALRKLYKGLIGEEAYKKYKFGN